MVEKNVSSTSLSQNSLRYDMYMSNIWEDLWNIFTYYAIAGNPLHPLHLSMNSLSRFLVDCGILGGANANSNLEINYHVMFIAILSKRRLKNHTYSYPKKKIFPKKLCRKNEICKIEMDTDISGLNFDEFLKFLLEASICFYGSRRPPEESLEHLIMEFVLPSSQKRPILKVPKKSDSNFEDMCTFLKVPLQEIFQNYSDVTLRHRKNLGNRSENCMSYISFVNFASEFRLTEGGILSISDLANIYITILSASHYGKFEIRMPFLRSISFPEFMMALELCAAISYTRQMEAENANSTDNSIFCGNTSCDSFMKLLIHMVNNVKPYSGCNGGSNEYSASFSRGILRLSERISQLLQLDYDADEYAIVSMNQDRKGRIALEGLLTAEF